MQTTFTQQAKGLDIHQGYSNQLSNNALSVLNTFFLQIKRQLLSIVETPAHVSKEIREEMYW